MTREIAIAKRCQLITGSFDGDECCCPCEGPADCQFVSEQRELLKNLPEIQERIELNRQRYNELTQENQTKEDTTKESTI